MERYPVYRGIFPLKSHFGRIVPRENGLKMMFFDVLRRFIFVFGGRMEFTAEPPQRKQEELTLRGNISA
jgi:hypothetical protein